MKRRNEDLVKRPARFQSRSSQAIVGGLHCRVLPCPARTGRDA
jgi:hypothetical protein